MVIDKHSYLEVMHGVGALLCLRGAVSALRDLIKQGKQSQIQEPMYRSC